MKRILKFIQLAKEALLRYPFVIAMSLVLTSYSIIEIMGWDTFYTSDFITNLFISFSIALPVLIVSTIISEQNKWSKLYFWLAKTAGVLIVPLGTFILSHYEIDNNYKLIASIGAIISTSVFLLLLLPYSKKDEEFGFWNFNLNLLIRLVWTFIFAGIIYGGIAAAFAIVDELFAFDIEEEAYGIAAIIIFCLGVPWSFVAVIPRDYEAQNNVTTLTTIGKILGKYIFLPLLGIYFVIFYAYGAKIAITGTWPEGVVAYMIMGMSLLGVATLLILYPLTKEGKSKLMKQLPLLYHAAILPLLGLYFMGISMRIAEYGFTLNRFFLVSFGIWQTLVAIYYIFGKRDIRFSFISLLAFILLTFFSPWNAFKVCEKSQVKRYIEILNSNELLTNGKLEGKVRWVATSKDDYQLIDKAIHNNSGLSIKDKDELRSIVSYICEYHNTEQLTSVFTGEIPLSKNYYTNEDRILASLDIEEYSYFSKDYFKYKFKYNRNIIPVSGFDYIVELDHINTPFKNSTQSTHDFDITLRLEDTTLVMEIDDRKLTLDLTEFIDYAKLNDEYTPLGDMTFEKEIDLKVSARNQHFKIVFDPNYIEWNYSTSEEKLSINNLDGRLLIKKL